MELTAAQRDALVTKSPPESSYDPEQDAEYLKRVIEMGTTRNGIFGITIHWFQLNDAVRRIQAYLRSGRRTAHELPTTQEILTAQKILFLSFPNVSYVWLRRRDKVAQAISWYKAIQTGRYVKVRDAREGGPARVTEVPFDYATIKTYWSALRSSENGWEHFFAANELKPFVVYYEDLAANFDTTIREVLAFLGLGNANVSIATPRNERAADGQSLEWIRRFEAMQIAARHRVYG
jgi:LPS sulfotransferase NodH